MRILILIAALAIAARALAGALSPDWKLSSDGYGPVTIGMTEAQAAGALGVALDTDKPPPGSDAQTIQDFKSCHEASAHGVPGLFFMIEDGRITSIAVTEPSHIKTTAGLGVGDTEARVRRTYGAALKIKPHEYENPPAHYLTVAGGKRGRGVKFATDPHGVVTQMYGGGASINYVEGCA